MFASGLCRLIRGSLACSCVAVCAPAGGRDPSWIGFSHVSLELRSLRGSAAMKDTAPGVETKWRALVMEKSPQERLAMAMSMMATAKIRMRAGILAAHPNVPEHLIKKEMLLRLYKNDFPKSVLDAIAGSPQFRKSCGA